MTAPQTPSTPPVIDPRHETQSFGSPPPHSVSQHTPSSQKFVSQSVAVVQAAPFIFAKISRCSSWPTDAGAAEGSAASRPFKRPSEQDAKTATSTQPIR